ncbi:histidine kinase [Actinoplanes sp. NPDC051513]|uniref:sensor histidine kinase n=1 Tax=Actinoplanes sp. NPDC051513 TaxID=3363908 RepID=UPI0037988E6E
MLRDELRALWNSPRAPDAPARVARDRLLVAAGLIATALEASLRADVPWRPVSALVTAGLCLTVLWRRSRPLAMVVLAFGGGILLTLVDRAARHPQPIGLYAGMIVLVLVYALARWGSGRDIVLGSAVILASFALSVISQPVGDIVGSLSFLAIPGALGAVVRLWSTSRRRELETMRSRERESFARELHDTVAHHVSAIVVRAQAGRVLAGADPASAAETLAGVEEEGVRTLEAMRAMVKALRDDDAGAELTPLPGIADLRRLSGRLPIDLGVDGVVDGLPPAVDAAVYRIVQESVTNASRHAVGATGVEVRVSAAPGTIRITVRDDGAASAARPCGYGLTGLRERATLLGGSLRAGPCDGRGWLVEAELPLEGIVGRAPSRADR